MAGGSIARHGAHTEIDAVSEPDTGCDYSGVRRYARHDRGQGDGADCRLLSGVGAVVHFGGARVDTYNTWSGFPAQALVNHPDHRRHGAGAGGNCPGRGIMRCLCCLGSGRLCYWYGNANLMEEFFDVGELE